MTAWLVASHVAAGVVLAIIISVALFDAGPGLEPQHLLAALVGAAAGFGVVAVRRSTPPPDVEDR